MTQAEIEEGLPRRTIDDLIARYQFEPELRDLFVEGHRDRGVYSWYLRGAGCKHVGVFEIDLVEIPSDALISHGLASGNRDRVIALALELDNQFPTVLQYVRCIADSDFDFIFESRNEVNHLLYTDYTSLDLYDSWRRTEFYQRPPKERTDLVYSSIQRFRTTSLDLYTYDEALLKKVLWLGFNVPETEIPPLLDSMSPILQDLFIIRAANQRLDWGLTLVPFTRCCEIDGQTVVFDKTEFINRCLNSSARQHERSAFDELCEELQAVCLSDPKQIIHGEDYFELLGWYLRRRWNWQGYRSGERSIMANLMVALDDRLLSDENLFFQINAIFR